MDTNKMRDISREQFEQWAKDRYGWHLHDDARDPEERTLASWNGETYGNRVVEGMWQSWQASREAVVVELPALGQPDSDFDASWHHTRNGTIDACKRVIEAQGLKVEVKP